MNFNQFNNPYYRNMANNLDPSSIRNMYKRVETMSDEELKNMMNLSGAGFMDPSSFRQMAKNMANCDDEQLKNMKNFMGQGGFPGPQASQSTPNTSNYNQANQGGQQMPNAPKSSSKSVEETINESFKKKESKFWKLNSAKEEGNLLFKQNKYKEAKEKYYELLNEVNYLEDVKGNDKIELQKLVNTTRLNISLCLLKLEDYELAIHECGKVLKEEESFKAHFRSGLAYYAKKNYEKAEFHFNGAKKFSKTNEEINSVAEYLGKLAVLKPKKETVVSQQPKYEESKCNIENNSNKKPNVEEVKEPEVKNEPKKEENESQQKTKKSTISRIFEKEKEEKSSQETIEQDNIIIEDTKEHKHNPNDPNCNHHHHTNTSQSYPQDMPSFKKSNSFNNPSIEEQKKMFLNMVRSIN